MFRTFVLLLFCFVLSTSFGQTWTNPQVLSNEWPLYGIGDPYVLKYNGHFYLYCSTRDSETGVKVWSSKNLNEWKYEGLCTTEPITHGAYAPEVIHWGGSFYMYTSPAGNGHYVLKSDHPAGPFVKVTGNLGHSIDGSVFKEDDGSLYFYHSGDDGIHAHKMNSPTSFGSEVVLRETRMDGWTEGPCVIKRNGKYHMIYTGNHVISKGYRIDVATSETSPVSGFVPDEYQNPVILNSEGDFVGLGHGSMFRGPNLDEYFITYHNLAGDYGVGPFRHLNFDRISFNEDRLLVHGPNNTPQVKPQMPDLYDYFESESSLVNWSSESEDSWSVSNGALQFYAAANKDLAMVLHSAIQTDNYTAEFNVKESSENDVLNAGVVFNYSDENNYGLALLNKTTNELEVQFISNGQPVQETNVALPGVDDYSIWHSIRIEKEQNSFDFYVDDMLKADFTQEMAAGKCGYAANCEKAEFGFFAFSGQINGSTSFEVPKPIPGTIAAVHYENEGKEVSYHLTNAGENNYRHDEVNLVKSDLGGYSIVSESGDWFRYNTWIVEDGTYNVGLLYSTVSEDCKIRIWQSDRDVSGIVSLSSTKGKDCLVPLGHFDLNSGEQKLKIEFVSGTCSFYGMKFKKFTETAHWSDAFDKSYSYRWKYKDGDWAIKQQTAQAKNSSKRTMGDDGWTDYSVVVDVKYTVGMNGGLVFRANNLALGGAGNNATQGTDFFQGYYVTIEKTGVTLGKHNYNYTHLSKYNGSYKQNVWYRLAVTVQGNTIKVFVDDLENPLIEYTDKFPFLSGKAGIRTHRSTVQFNNFLVSTKSISDLSTSSIDIPTKDQYRIYPNPAKNELFISHEGSMVKAEIFDLMGAKIEECTSIENLFTFDLEGRNAGTYLVKLTNGEQRTIADKFLIF